MEITLADDTYVVDLLVTGTQTITLTDDGSGTDTIRVNGIYTSTVQISLAYTSEFGLPTSGSGIYYNPTGIGHSLIVNGVIENAVGSDGQDFIQGNSIANLIYGDALASGAGLNDTLWAGSGNDTVHGGSGSDGILGDGDDDLLYGDADNDTINGGGGVDTLEGGLGADVMSGGGTAGDTLSYASSASGIQITLEYGSATIGTGGDAAGDQVTGFSNVAGSGQNDRIEELVKGTLAFGYNDNVFSGGAGHDRLILGGGKDKGIGGAGNDTVSGELGNDVLNGGNGNDKLQGGVGKDTGIGGVGADIFLFQTAADSTAQLAGRDTIIDFSTAQHDIIDLFNIDAEAGVPGDQAFHFITTGFQGNVGELRAKVSGSDLIVMGDINGDRTADFAILLLNVASVTAADFHL